MNIEKTTVSHNILWYFLYQNKNGIDRNKNQQSSVDLVDEQCND